MSSSVGPIDNARFAQAIEDLPIDTLHAKAAEIENSIQHLRHSNEQMMPFADEGDQDCKEAMFENLGVINRMNQRIELLKAEVERRGLPWTADVEVLADKVDKNGELVNGTVGSVANGITSHASAPSVRERSGRLTDEELRRQVEAQMGGEDEDEGEGVHL